MPESMMELHRKVTVEPVLFLFNIASQIVWVTSQELMVEKSCQVNYGYTDEVCGNLSEHESKEADVQSLVSDYLMWRSILETSIKIVSIPLLAWWGDKVGRKGPFILCLACLGLESASLLLNSLVWSWPLEANLMGSFFYGISGGTHSLLMLGFSFLAERTSTGKRTLRMSILDGFYYLGSPVGLAIAPPLFHSLGYSGVFATSVLIYVISIAYVTLRLSGRPFETKKENDDSNATDCSDCGVSRLSDAFYTTFRRRPNKATKYILISIVAMLLDSFVIWGEANVKYLFTQRALDWQYTEYSHYGSACTFLEVLGALVIVPLLTLRTHLQDNVIGLLGSCSRFLERLFYVFATTPSRSWLMYAGSVAGTGSPLAPIAIRAQISKLSPEDVGQVYAVMAIGETLLPFATAPIYTSLYEATVTTYPGAFYLLSMAFCALMALCFVYLYFTMRPKDNER